jgi:hypothetical protein
MKYTKLRLVGPTNIDLPLRGLDPMGPFVLKSADGLGPTKVDVFIANRGSAPGGVYQNRRPQLRFVTLEVGLQPSWNVGQTSDDLRDMLYGLLAPENGTFVTLQIMDGDVVLAEAEGHLSGLEPNLFTKDPQVQITLDCTHPYFKAPGFGSVQTPVLTKDSLYTYFTIDNPGTATAGFFMAIKFGAPHSATLQLLETVNMPRFMSINYPFATGDVLSIDTRDESRAVSVTPGGSGAAVSILDSLSSGSPWLQLHGGANQFKINDPSITWSPFLPVVVRPMFLGV